MGSSFAGSRRRQPPGMPPGWAAPAPSARAPCVGSKTAIYHPECPTAATTTTPPTTKLAGRRPCNRAKSREACGDTLCARRRRRSRGRAHAPSRPPPGRHGRKREAAELGGYVSRPVRGALFGPVRLAETCHIPKPCGRRVMQVFIHCPRTAPPQTGARTRARRGPSILAVDPA